jgi:hypothetical protein
MKMKEIDVLIDIRELLKEMVELKKKQLGVD